MFICFSSNLSPIIALYTGISSGTTTLFIASFTLFITFSSEILNPICFVVLLISKILYLSFGISLCFLFFILETFVLSWSIPPKISNSSVVSVFSSTASFFISFSAVSISFGVKSFNLILFINGNKSVDVINKLSVSSLFKFFRCILSIVFPNFSMSSS